MYVEDRDLCLRRVGWKTVYELATVSSRRLRRVLRLFELLERSYFEHQITVPL